MKILIATTLLVISTSLVAQEKTCDYYGLPEPTAKPQDFNPDLLDLNGSFKFNIAINDCHTIYFTTIDTKENIYFSKKRNGKWSKPEIATFSDPSYSDADPFLTQSGDRIYFISERPTSTIDKQLDWNIWYASYKEGEWTEPNPLPVPINTDESDEYFFSISDKGNAFFSSNRIGGEGSFDIYMTKILGDNKFSEPKNIGQPVSTNKYEFDPYIAPDERFIIFSINEDGNSNLYVSHKNQRGEWMTPTSLGDEINITHQDFAPSLSADGRFIFYSNNGRLRWVSADILDVPPTK